MIVRIFALIFLFSTMTVGAASQPATTGHKQQTAEQHADHEHESSAGMEADDDHGDQTDGHDHEKTEHGHGEGAGHNEEAQAVRLSARQQQLAEVKVAPLEKSYRFYRLYAPGEVRANGYTSYLVSPRVDSVVIKRHLTLGEHVRRGQKLVTLFSDTVAQTQAAYQLALSEWQRVRGLGRKAVGEQRYVAAQGRYQALRSQLLAYGLDADSIDQLDRSHDVRLGEYALRAPIDGVVLTDDFHQGQRIEAGGTLITLVDEGSLWVEARTSSRQLLKLPAGTRATVKVGDIEMEARLAQEAHTIDPQTRTRVIRLLLKNPDDKLHPGMFADVYFELQTAEPVLAVPQSALMRSSDGDWVVYVATGKEQFEPREVELGQTLGDWQQIQGIEPGTPVVMEGAFFVASEQAKSGFDPHNH